jgi:hypothetical protein
MRFFVGLLHPAPPFPPGRRALFRGLAPALAALLAVLTAWGQDGTGTRTFIFFPHPIPEHQWKVSVGLTTTTPAKELTEEVAIRAPSFDAHALYGLPENLSLDGRVISQVVQNHFSLGPRWSQPLGRFTFGLGYDVAYWFGALEVGGFDSKAHGWLNYPSISLGYAWDDVLLTLKFEAVLTTSYTSFVGENEVSSDVDAFSGTAYAIYIEQPFWKDTHVTLGFRATYTKFHWMAWALFSTFDRYLFFPEMTIGFIL